ncbi:MAG: CRISPR-associated protein Csx15 [Thermomicrobiales bacterium]
MIVVNFSHPLTEAQRAQIAERTGASVERVIDVPTHFDDATSYADQAPALVAAASLTAAEWQTLPLLINPPAFAPVAAALLASLHGLIGHFPSVIRIRPVRAAGPPTFEVAEIMNLQAVRDQVRSQRGAL